MPHICVYITDIYIYIERERERERERYIYIYIHDADVDILLSVCVCVCVYVRTAKEPYIHLAKRLGVYIGQRKWDFGGNFRFGLLFFLNSGPLGVGVNVCGLKN